MYKEPFGYQAAHLGYLLSPGQDVKRYPWCANSITESFFDSF